MSHGYFIWILIFISACKTTPSNKSIDSSTHFVSKKFIKITAGTYPIGGKDHPINPRRKIKLSPFYISNTEVTNAEFAAFVKANQYITDAEKLKNAKVFYVGLGEFQWKEDTTAYWRFPNGKNQGGIEDKMNHPVTAISYRDVLKYCKWAKVRLPTLDEWEVACRAKATTRFFWGQKPEGVENYANIWVNRTHKKVEVQDTHLYTSPVGSYQPNVWGLYDMYGNVFEFCEGVPTALQKYTYLAYARGGSWWCSRTSCNFFNSVDIGSVHQNASFSNQGFRVVLLENK
jgi:formylglycine-generating enzyme